MIGAAHAAAAFRCSEADVLTLAAPWRNTSKRMAPIRWVGTVPFECFFEIRIRSSRDDLATAGWLRKYAA